MMITINCCFLVLDILRVKLDTRDKIKFTEQSGSRYKRLRLKNKKKTHYDCYIDEKRRPEILRVNECCPRETVFSIISNTKLAVIYYGNFNTPNPLICLRATVSFNCVTRGRRGFCFYYARQVLTKVSPERNSQLLYMTPVRSVPFARRQIPTTLPPPARRKSMK